MPVTYILQTSSTRPSHWREWLGRAGEGSSIYSGLPAGAVAADAMRSVREVGRHGPWTDAAVAKIARRCRRLVRAFWSDGLGPNRADMSLVHREARQARWGLPSLLGGARKSRRGARKSRLHVTLWCELPKGKEWTTAVCLSTWFGLSTGRLRLCKVCQAPFAVPLELPGQRKCESCRQRAQRYVADPPPYWTCFRRRLATLVHRKVLSRADRDVVVALARWELGQISASMWRDKWRLPRLREGRNARKANGAIIHVWASELLSGAQQGKRHPPGGVDA